METCKTYVAVNFLSSVKFFYSFVLNSLLYITIPKNKGCLRRRRNLTPVSNVCEAAPISVFWTPRRTQRITGSAFRISFQLDITIPETCCVSIVWLQDFVTTFVTFVVFRPVRLSLVSEGNYILYYYETMQVKKSRKTVVLSTLVSV